jgi:PPIC-type PPIASE domain
VRATSLRETWTLQWQREPTAEELRGAVRQLLNEQLLALEAHTMRLDENDTVVRRRLAQKLNFIIEGTTRLVEPTEQALLAYYTSHPNQFRTEARVSFTQVYFSSINRKDPTADARQSLAELLARGDNEPEATIGDRFLLGPEFHHEREQMVSRAFGREFAEAVIGLMPGTWSGPIESVYGLHLVRVSALEASQLRPFADVRSQVLEAWRREQEKTANEQYLGRLRGKYNVVIDDGVKTLIGGL